MPFQKNISELGRRLAAMERSEIADRLRQQIRWREDWLRFRLGRPMTEKIEEKFSQRSNFFFQPEQVPRILELLRERLPQQVAEIVARAERILHHKFDLLGYRGLDYGREIDWHLDKVHEKRAPRRIFYKVPYLNFAAVGDAKITWELNRHQHLVTLAKAYRLTGDERFAREIFTQWYQWRKENPYPVGMNWASSLEVGLRSLSWLWMVALLLETPVGSQDFLRDLQGALGVSGRHLERYLSTYFSPNTHLLGEGVALFAIGLLCPRLSSAVRWREKGWKIVLAEARRQVLPDGMHFERSLYYHVYALDLLTHAGLLAARNDIATPPEFDATILRMMEVVAMLSAAGTPPRFGDDDGGRVFDGQRNQTPDLVDPLSTGAVIFNRPDFKALAGGLREETIWLLGWEGVRQFDEVRLHAPPVQSAALADAGFYIMASREPVPQQLVIGAGGHGTGPSGHNHADALSVQLISQGRVLLGDRGTFKYVGEGNARAEFRGTSAHNTLTVDGQNQSLPKGPFAWERLARSTVEHWMAGESFDFFSGSHDGYQRHGVAHRRSVFHRKGQFWLVRDLAEGSGSYKLQVAWHLGAGMTPARSDGGFELEDQSGGLSILNAGTGMWSQERATEPFSGVYGQAQNAAVLRFHCEAELSQENVTLLAPYVSVPGKPGILTRLEEPVQNHEVKSYQYVSGETVHGFFFQLQPRPWIFGSWASDAEFVYFERDRAGMKSLVFCQGSYVEWGRQRIVSSQQPVTWGELRRSGSKTLIASSQPEHVLLHHPLEELSPGRGAIQPKANH